MLYVSNTELLDISKTQYSVHDKKKCIKQDTTYTHT